MKNKQTGEWWKKPCKSAKDEAFVQALVTTTINQTEAFRRIWDCAKWKAESIWQNASKTYAKVKPRIEWLKEQQSSANVMKVVRRKELLSRIAEEIGSHDPADYISAGADGVYITFGPESRNRKAIAGIESHTEISGEGGSKASAVVTKLKLRSHTEAVQAIAELNKMEGVYEPEKHTVGVTDELRTLLQTMSQDQFGAAHLAGKGKKA